MGKYIDADKLIANIEKISPYSSSVEGVLNLIHGIIASLQQEQPEDTDALRAKLVNFLLRNDIQEDKAKYLSDRISDTYGAQRYMDGLCDAANAYEQEHPEVDLEKEIEWEWAHRNKQEVDLIECAEMDKEEFARFARHFWNKGYNARKT